MCIRDSIPVSAIARRESMPICSVSRSRQTHRRPGFKAGLMPESVSRPTDILVSTPGAGDRPDSAGGFPAGRSPFPGSNGGPPPGGLVAGTLGPAIAKGQFTSVDNAVDYLGRVRRVAVDTGGDSCEFPASGPGRA